MCDFLRKQIEQKNLETIVNNAFFQFTINTNKLGSLLNNFEQKIDDNQSKNIKAHNDMIKMIQSLENKLNLETQKNSMLLTKINKQIVQNSNIVKLYVNDLDNSIKRNQKTIQDLNCQLTKTKRQINKINDGLQDQFIKGLQYLRKDIIGTTSQDQELNNQNQKQQQLLLNKTIKLQNFATTYSYFQDRLKTIQKDFPQKVEKMIMQQQQKMKKANKQQFIQKGLKKEQMLRQIEQNQKMNNSISINKLVYSSFKARQQPNSTSESPTYNKNNINRRDPHKCQRHMSLKLYDNDYQILQNFKALEEDINLNIKKQMDQFRNKIVVLDEKISILSRKNDKFMHQVGEVRMLVRKFQTSKNQDKSLQQLRNYVKWIIRDFEQKIALKCENIHLEAQKRKIYEKIAIVHQNLSEKAEKGQIQKALIFLEGKIKQIILLIAAEQNEERDGAMVKTAIKCLSCDKDLQKNINQFQSKKTGEIPRSGSYSRSLTHRTRQKYKQAIKQTMTSGNQSVEYI